MKLHQDIRELIGLCLSRKVEFLLVGGYALAFHGAPRFTEDIDLLVLVSPDNADKLFQVLTEFGFGDSGISREDSLDANQVCNTRTSCGSHVAGIGGLREILLTDALSPPRHRRVPPYRGIGARNLANDGTRTKQGFSRVIAPLPLRVGWRINDLPNMNPPHFSKELNRLMDPYWRKARIAARLLIKREDGKPWSPRDRRLASQLSNDRGVTNQLLDQAYFSHRARKRNGRSILDIIP